MRNNSLKSLLFVPANRSDRFQKALDCNSSVVIIDFEDAVNREDKRIARDNVSNFLTKIDHRIGKQKIFIRINNTESEFFDEDLVFLKDHTRLIRAVALPKIKNEKDLEPLDGFNVMPIVESASGIENIFKIASVSNVFALSFGYLDMSFDLNLPDLSVDFDINYGRHFLLNYIRSQITLASSLYKLGSPIEGVFPNIKDVDGFTKALKIAKGMGFGGALCIHPNQVQTIHSIFSFSKEEIEWAKKIVELAELHNNDVFELDGKMIDLPVIKKAENILKHNNQY